VNLVLFFFDSNILDVNPKQEKGNFAVMPNSFLQNTMYQNWNIRIQSLERIHVISLWYMFRLQAFCTRHSVIVIVTKLTSSKTWIVTALHGNWKHTAHKIHVACAWSKYSYLKTIIKLMLSDVCRVHREYSWRPHLQEARRTGRRSRVMSVWAGACGAYMGGAYLGRLPPTAC